VSTLAKPSLVPATAPAEADGGRRDDVALLVATRSDGRLHGGRFAELPEHLRPGDLLVVNTSATIPAALPARLDGAAVRVHLSTRLSEDRWVLELRAEDLGRLDRPPPGTRLELPDGGRITVVAAYRGSSRLTEAEVDLPGGTSAYLRWWAAPIRYPGHAREWGLDAYQTVFAREPGSVEMPSAGRPFSPELVTRLVAGGVLIAPLVLHAGVSSLESGEAPYPEPYDVPAETARLVNAVHAWAGRVIAVGTTVVRALETAATPGLEDPLDSAVGTHPLVRESRGWTELMITPQRGLRVVDGLITGWHEPESSHLLMLEAACGRELLARSYAAAQRRGFSGHEFGDVHLILP
jgi:S-adenosylmethionine:tRNA ribosyltransferase-isomerase